LRIQMSGERRGRDSRISPQYGADILEVNRCDPAPKISAPSVDPTVHKFDRYYPFCRESLGERSRRGSGPPTGIAR
jgi:hypothetical protein